MVSLVSKFFEQSDFRNRRTSQPYFYAGTSDATIWFEETLSNINDDHWHSFELVRNNNSLSVSIDGVVSTST